MPRRTRPRSPTSASSTPAPSGISIPILNEAGILQVSPGNAYIGLTRRESAQPGEPAKYYPTNQRTFGRVSQADHLQAAAVAALLQQEGAKRVFLVDDLEIYGDGLADMVRRRIKARGVRFAGRRHLRKRNAGAIARAIRRSRADAMFYGGIAENGAARCGAPCTAATRSCAARPRGCHRPRLRPPLSRGAARRTLITSPTLDPAAYPPAAQAFYTAFRARFGHEPRAYAIYGYEAMSVVLDAIARAGSARPGGGRGRLPRHQGPRLRARPLLDRRQRRHHALGPTACSRSAAGRLVYDRTIDSAR